MNEEDLDARIQSYITATYGPERIATGYVTVIAHETADGDGMIQYHLATADNQTGHSTIGLLHIGGDLLTEAMYGDSDGD